MALLREISGWVSASNFTEDEVEQGALDRIVEAARRAPSAKNRQPWRLIVVRNPEVRKALYDSAFGEERVGQAPVIMALCTTNVDYRMPNGQQAYPIDIGIVSSFIMLQARAEGLGSRVITTYDEESVREVLTVPHLMRVVLLILVGHTDGDSLQKERRPFSQIVSYDHW
ncbi:MAG: nitroreductase family protein [Spirochaetia bacterium]